MIFQPDNVWVIERALGHDPDTDAALLTCHMRGWVETLHDAVPKTDLKPDGRLPDNFNPKRIEPMYRLTEAGWCVIYRTHLWVLATFIVALATLIATFSGVMITRAISERDATQGLNGISGSRADTVSCLP